MFLNVFLFPLGLDSFNAYLKVLKLPCCRGNLKKHAAVSETIQICQNNKTCEALTKSFS